MEGIGRVEHVHRLAEAALIDDDITTRLGRKDDGVETPELIHHEILHPAVRFCQELAVAHRHTRPGRDMVQAAATITTRPHGGIRRHGHHKKAGRARPRNLFHHPLTG